MIQRTPLLYAALLVFSASTTFGHKPSDSYLRVDRDAERFTAEWDIAVRDLEVLVGLDDDQDGKVTWAELKAKRAAVAAHALSRLKVRAGETTLSLDVTELRVNEHSDGAYAALQLEAAEDSAGAPVTLQYDLLFDIDPTHRGLVLVRGDGGDTTYVLGPDSSIVTLDGDPPSLWRSLADYVGEGVWHIWIGFDHILFLVTLLLPAVLIRTAGEWVGVESFGQACRGVLAIVTTFTVAHSITLWLSVMEYVSLPSQWVEATIALSIVVTAAANLLPKLPTTGWRVAFVFGLIHGFGFANVLVDLGLGSATLGAALLGFNIGVELGQIAIVLAVLPITYSIRRSAFYRVAILWAGSTVIGLIALVWFYERTFNATILGI